MCIKASQSYFYDRKLQKFSPTAFPMIYVGCRAPSTIFDQYGGGSPTYDWAAGFQSLYSAVSGWIWRRYSLKQRWLPITTVSHSPQLCCLGSTTGVTHRCRFWCRLAGTQTHRFGHNCSPGCVSDSTLIPFKLYKGHRAESGGFSSRLRTWHSN